MGRAGRLTQRRLQGAATPRSVHARQALESARWLPGAPRAATRASARTAHRYDPAGRAGRHRLFYVGRLHGTKGAVWQLTAIDTYSSFAWAELVRCDGPGPDQGQTSRFAHRVARTLRQAGWRLERVLTDNGNEFAHHFGDAITALGARQTKIRAGRPQTNGHVERLHRTILEECWRPAFARYLYLRYRGLQRELDAYLTLYNHHRAHTGRITNGRCPSELVYGARKMEPR